MITRGPPLGQAHLYDLTALRGPRSYVRHNCGRIEEQDLVLDLLNTRDSSTNNTCKHVHSEGPRSTLYFRN